MARFRPEESRISGILFGAAYYTEYQTTDRLDEDLDLMQEAGFTVIRVGESVWSTWEPRDGDFDLDWLQPVLDGAHKRGISVILGTPTYAIPPWLQKKHPELAGETESGKPMPWGGRQEADYSSPVFRHYAERVIRKITQRYADHPAIIGFQVDNEPGLLLLHNAGTFAEFVNRLRQKYGTPERLNEEWGLVYWSHRIAEWNELWVPDGNWQPQYDLAWRRYQADVTTEYIAWQADIVRQYASADQFVTTCIAYGRPALNDLKLAADLDVTAGNPYYAMQDGLDATKEAPSVAHFTSTGVWGLIKQADRLYSTKQERFLVTETDAASIGGPSINYPPYPGQLAQAALALISRGAAMIEYWHWHTLHFGTETYWGGVLPHSQKPGRIYREVAALGATLKKLGPVIEGYTPDADIGFLFSTDSRFAFQFFPPLTTPDGAGDPSSYDRIFDSFYRGVIESGRQARVLHVDQFVALDAGELARTLPVLVVPGFYISTDSELDALRAYAEAGGHLVLGPRTGYADVEGRARLAVAPAGLSDAAQVWYEEFSNLHGSLPVVGAGDVEWPAAAAATAWADGLIVDGAEVIARYEHPELGRFPAVTTASAGQGRITTVGTVPNPAFGRALAEWMVASPIASEWDSSNAPGVIVSSGVVENGSRVWFIHNWSSVESSLPLPSSTTELVDLDTGHALTGTALSLGPWSVRILIER
ncbi:MAG: beta-galactosidase [Glaciihabitans sp.]|nr:beta-galactosidase [Glaciihabitans sp.]